MFKRAFDLVVPLLVILVALPLWLAVAIALKLKKGTGHLLGRNCLICQGSVLDSSGAGA